MSTQDNLRIIDDWMAALNENDLDRWVAMHADRVAWHFPESGNALQGHEQLRAAIDSFISRQPDVRFDKVEAFSQGKMVCLEWTEIGTLAETGESCQMPSRRRYRVNVRYKGTLFVDICHT